MEKNKPKDLYEKTKNKMGYKGLYQLIIKRIIDIVASFIGLILLSPLILIVSILIKLESKGEVIFKQKKAS